MRVRRLSPNRAVSGLRVHVSRLGRLPRPNNAVEPTPRSLRSAAASGRGSPRALARTLRAAPTEPRLPIRCLSRRSAPGQPAAAADGRSREPARVPVPR